MTGQCLFLRKLLQINGVCFSDSALEKIVLYQEQILSWNQKVNLISRKDENNLIFKHILASLSVLFLRQLAPRTSMVDIGTGGGFPGIPLAILNPEINFLLLDSIKKKIVALQSIVSELHLENVEITCGRAEELGAENRFQKSFDYVISRAVGPTNDILKWGKPFLKPKKAKTVVNVNSSTRSFIASGSIILLKGGELTNEIELAKIKHHPEYIEVIPVVFNGSEGFDFAGKKIVIIQP